MEAVPAAQAFPLERPEQAALTDTKRRSVQVSGVHRAVDALIIAGIADSDYQVAIERRNQSSSAPLYIMSLSGNLTDR